MKALEPLSTDRGATWKESLYEDGLQHRKGTMVPCPIEQAFGNMVYWHTWSSLILPPVIQFLPFQYLRGSFVKYR